MKIRWREIKRNCKHCGEPLVFTNRNQAYNNKYCNKSCATTINVKRRVKGMVRVCLECKAEFSPNATIQTYCGEQCQKNANKHKHKMGGNWLKAMERDGYQCRICSTPEDILVHHIDGTGEKDSPNHQLENLAVVCRSCHCKIHQLSFKIVNGVMMLDNPTYKLTGLLPIVFLDQVVTPTLVNT